MFISKRKKILAFVLAFLVSIPLIPFDLSLAEETQAIAIPQIEYTLKGETKTCDAVWLKSMEDEENDTGEYYVIFPDNSADFAPVFNNLVFGDGRIRMVPFADVDLAGYCDFIHPFAFEFFRGRKRFDMRPGRAVDDADGWRLLLRWLRLDDGWLRRGFLLSAALRQRDFQVQPGIPSSAAVDDGLIEELDQR